MDVFLVVTVFIIVLWLVAIGYYLYTVRQQADIEQSIKEIRDKLDEEGDEAVVDQDI